MLMHLRVTLVMVNVMLSALAVSSASAAEWHTNGHRPFSSTNAGPSRLDIRTGASTALLECASTTGVGTLGPSTVSGSTVVGIVRFTPLFGGPCTVNGTPGFSVVCNTAQVNALSYSGGTTFATAGGGVTSGSMTNVDCVVGAAGTNCSTFTGLLNVHYINPATLNGATSPGSLTLTLPGQGLTVTKIGVGCAAIPNGVGTFGRPGPGSMVTDITYVIDGPNAPWMFRTP
jgi:hypothetical protein